MGVNIYVANLKFSTSEATLQSLFEQFGQVDRVHICTDRDTGQSRGFGFVEMPNQISAERAIEDLDGRQCEGRPITVRKAHPRRRK